LLLQSNTQVITPVRLEYKKELFYRTIIILKTVIPFTFMS